LAHIHQCMQYMRASKIKHGLVINFPQHHARDIDIYDCKLGVGLSPGKIAEEDQALAGDFGPAPAKEQRNILSYVDYQYDCDFSRVEDEGVEDEESFSPPIPHKKRNRRHSLQNQAKVQVETTSQGSTKTSFFIG